MRKGFTAIFLTAGLLLFAGAGCLSGDIDLLAGFVSRWLEQRGVVDKNGNPTANTIKYVGSGGYISSGDEGNDAIIDAGRAAKGIKAADEAVDAAHNFAAVGKFDLADASLNEQLAERPNDHHVRNAKGAILMRQGRGGEAKNFLASTTTCNTSAGNVKPSDFNRCMSMLRDEEDQLNTATPPYGGSRQAAAVDSPECDLVRQRVTTLVRLEDISRMQSRFDAADGYMQKRINLEGSSPSCRR